MAINKAKKGDKVPKPASTATKRAKAESRLGAVFAKADAQVPPVHGSRSR